MAAPLGGELALTEGSMLNEFFIEMVEVIFIRGGMLDKYMGDGLMAIFGAPVMGSADADNALCVATDMVRALGAFKMSTGHGTGPSGRA